MSTRRLSGIVCALVPTVALAVWMPLRSGSARAVTAPPVEVRYCVPTSVSVRSDPPRILMRCGRNLYVVGLAERASTAMTTIAVTAAEGQRRVAVSYYVNAPGGPALRCTPPLCQLIASLQYDV